MERGGTGFRFSIILIILVILLFFSRIAGLVTDFWWFDSLGFSGIFLISLKAKILLFAATAVFFFAFIMANLWISSRFSESAISLRLKAVIAAVIAVFAGLAAYPKWLALLQYLNQVNFNIADPVFMRDVSFYVFSLPFYIIVWKLLLACLITAIIATAIDYFQASLSNIVKQKAEMKPQTPSGEVPSVTIKSIMPKARNKALAHLAVLGAVFFGLLAFRHYISRYSIMYSEKGIVVGAGYTDVVAVLPAIKLLMVLALAISVLFIFWVLYISKHREVRKKHVIPYAIGAYALVFIIGLAFIPGLIQSLKVSPNEINLEKQYIKHNINFTRIAYGLDDIEEKDFDVELGLDPQKLSEASETLDNVRVLDWRPLTQTYKQTQEIRLYYDLSGIDIDRYNIDGKYTEVMLSPRELKQENIADNAKTWVNLHMIYTHGYGLVMSPVNNVTEEGLPNYFIKDIPPSYTVEEESIRIDNPQIYYGEQDNNFVLVDTKTREFDYPKGDENEYTHHEGDGGVELSSFFRKLLMAIRFSDIKILLSSDVTDESRIMFMRSIQKRISKITPFLLLDEDPYLVVSDGKLYWIQDAYTVTDKFPYSEKADSRSGINYIRNSVKVVVDAYNGDVTYYVADKEDSIIQTYARIFPQEFKSLSSMPEGLRKHIRYPEGLFSLQSKIYMTYHMSDPTVFYNKEDAWEVPNEIYGTGQRVQMEPYYVILNLPGEDEAEFVLMIPFTPTRKDNMIAWMAARSDGDDYGKLLVYNFPKDKLVYGPSQVEAKFDQDSEISQQLTLWSQRGSRITRGNLLVIPIEESILYIEPLYLASEQGELPQMKRVLVSDGERVVMEETLDQSLEALFGKKKEKPSDTGEKRLREDMIKEAGEHYESILDAMENNDWQGFGESFDKLGNVLEELKRG